MFFYEFFLLCVTPVNQKSPYEIARIICDNIRKRRKELKLSQIKLAQASGVSLGSIKRFENSAEISIISLIKIAITLDLSEDLVNLFSRKKYLSIEDIIKEGKDIETY